jgi:quercetin dioxygenase-like cupin family protein
VSAFRVAFESLPWEHGRPGVRYKTYREQSRQLRLVEFDTGEGFQDWCEQGHIGYVLAGGLDIEVQGTVLSLAAGDGLFLPAGTAAAHRALSIVPGTRLVMVEDI